MIDYDDLSSALKGEMLTDLAEGFFGARKAIDNEISIFQTREADLHLSGQRALCTFALMYMLLRKGKDIPMFCEVIRVSPEFTARLEGVAPCLYIPPPFAFTKASRFAKLLVSAYGHACKAFSTYLHGASYFHPDKHIPVRTIGYHRYLEWGTELNKRITEVNTAHAPSDVMNVAHSLEVEAMGKEQSTGSTISGLRKSFDSSLHIPQVSLENKGIGLLPELEESKQQHRRISFFAKQLYTTHTEEIEQCMAEIAREHDTILQHDCLQERTQQPK